MHQHNTDVVLPPLLFKKTATKYQEMRHSGRYVATKDLSYMNDCLITLLAAVRHIYLREDVDVSAIYIDRLHIR